MAGWEADGVRVRREVGEVDRPGVDDEQAEDAVALGQVTDASLGLVVDADRHERLEALARRVDHAERGITGAGEVLRRLDDPAQHTLELEARADRQHRVEERLQLLDVTDRVIRHGAILTAGAAPAAPVLRCAGAAGARSRPAPLSATLL